MSSPRGERQSGRKITLEESGLSDSPHLTHENTEDTILNEGKILLTALVEERKKVSAALLIDSFSYR